MADFRKTKSTVNYTYKNNHAIQYKVIHKAIHTLEDKTDKINHAYFSAIGYFSV